ncbi:MAG: metal-dependent hydrolase [Candidatus Aminicenantes bacterium]|nr:metal-dependent hydrolase [Candidatus Aminicenantes bacterium]
MTPIVHSAIGLLGWQKAASKKNIKTLFLFVLISNIPDIDFLIFLFVDGKGLQVHQSHTHNIFFIGIFTFLLFFFFKKKKERLALFLVSFSHLVLDLIIIDPVPPIGFRVFFPVWNKLFNFGFFPNFLRGGFADVFSLPNLMTISMEVLCFVVPILYLCGKEVKVHIKKKEFWKI